MAVNNALKLRFY